MKKLISGHFRMIFGSDFWLWWTLPARKKTYVVVLQHSRYCPEVKNLVFIPYSSPKNYAKTYQSPAPYPVFSPNSSDFEDWFFACLIEDPEVFWPALPPIKGHWFWRKEKTERGGGVKIETKGYKNTCLKFVSKISGDGKLPDREVFLTKIQSGIINLVWSASKQVPCIFHFSSYTGNISLKYETFC